MRAMVLHQHGPVDDDRLHLEDVPEPVPAAGEILVRVEATGICPTDLHVIEAEIPPGKVPVIPGHQLVGRVVARGRGAERFAVGEYVGVAALGSACGTCRYCAGGQENICLDARFTGYTDDGGYAEQVRAREEYAYPIPAGLRPEETAPLLCAGTIGFRALRRSEIRPGGRLGLYGFGASAHVTIQIANHWGCDVYVATRGERQQALARELGAVWVGDTGDSPPVQLDAAIIFVPDGSLVPLALESLDRGGALALAVSQMSEVPPLDYWRHLYMERTVRSVQAHTRQDGIELLRLAVEIPIRPHVETFPLQDANTALRRLKAGEIEGAGVLLIGDAFP